MYLPTISLDQNSFVLALGVRYLMNNAFAHYLMYLPTIPLNQNSFVLAPSMRHRINDVFAHYLIRSKQLCFGTWYEILDE